MKRAVAALIVMMLAAPISAHIFEQTEVEAIFDGKSYRIDLLVDVDALALGVSSSTDSEEVVAALRALSDGELAAAAERVRGTLSRRVRVRFDDQKQRPTISFPGEEVQLIEADGLPTVLGLTARLEGEIPTGAANFQFGLSRAFGPSRLSVGVQGSQQRRVELLGTAEDSPLFDLTALLAAPPLLPTMLRYTKLGFIHILPAGLDHILFIVGLFLLARRWQALVAQISLFTIAHTLTLGLAAASIVALPPRWVEPLIALSIAWVAIENIWAQRITRWRLLVVFAFGLLHGLGFAGALGELGLPPGRFVSTLASFNLGVELGQLAVIALSALLLWRWRNREDYQRRVVVPISVLIAAVGLYWAVERVLT
jgi:hypothetical protein